MSEKTRAQGKENFLIYGSYGYSGSLIADLAVACGLKPVLGGRNRNKLEAQAKALGLDYRPFDLDDPASIRNSLVGIAIILNCAGPFSHTYQSILASCLQTGTHYLDITGEISVFEGLAARSDEARAAGVMLMPGVGFDIVPTDCLAAHLKKRLPTANRLALAFQPFGTRFSRGTAKSGIERIHQGGLIRQGGRLTQVPAAWKTRQIDFGHGPIPAISIPWGDVATAYYTTGIPNIEVYLAAPALLRWIMAIPRYSSWLLSLTPVKSILKSMVALLPAGPSEKQRAHGSARLWGEATDPAGNRAAARMRTPEVYALTAQTAVAALEKALGGNRPPGFQTPAKVFGPDFILEVEGVSREDLQ